MGRGRAQAKQTKVARELKYHDQGTDLSALQAELAADSHPKSDPTEVEPDYSKWIDDEEDGDEEA